MASVFEAVQEPFIDLDRLEDSLPRDKEFVGCLLIGPTQPMPDPNLRRLQDGMNERLYLLTVINGKQSFFTFVYRPGIPERLPVKNVNNLFFYIDSGDLPLFTYITPRVNYRPNTNFLGAGHEVLGGADVMLTKHRALGHEERGQAPVGPREAAHALCDLARRLGWDGGHQSQGRRWCRWRDCDLAVRI
ncbi:hypothetical protein BDY19DRAFT_1025536 [Irpex rosettiformis]|uniref:Uncharacterized protein n=1 Tax=Irpex rosettiformis TaxID=378272 RepID=A0ACB8TRD1_9APHY|nr:hypothetical protein BDY19DRAFT_1025536 [Irpex rosettiformis]